MSCVEYKTNDMSMKNQTQLVVNCSNNISKPLIESEKFQVIAPTPKVPLRGRRSSSIAQDDQSCSSVKNLWLLGLLGVTVVFTLAVAIVVFAALHYKLSTSLQTTSLEIERLKNIMIFEGLQRRLVSRNLKTNSKMNETQQGNAGNAGNAASLQSIKSTNGTDNKGRICPRLKGEKDEKPNPQSSSKNNQKNDSRVFPNDGGSRRSKSRPRTVFVRWGTSQCRTSSNTSLVYKGRVASPNYKDKGGGTNYLCMPDRALYTSLVDIGNADRAFLYPVKFGPVTKVFNMFADKARLQRIPGEKRKLLNYTLDYKDVPCAVCRVDGATAALMIPAYNICPPPWDRQYHGYLMSQKHNSEKSELICVDVDARGIPNTANKNADSLLHLTEYKCGSSRCGRLQPRKALACAVCTT